MKSRLGMIVILLLAVMLTTYSDYLSAQADISQAWKGSRNSRTWVVFEFMDTPPRVPGFHIEIGDTFRIQGVRTHMQFVPLGKLRGRWNRAEISLNKEGANGQRLCGTFNLDNHPEPPSKQHFVLIEADSGDENKIYISISDDENFSCGNPTHGGRAHAEN